MMIVNDRKKEKFKRNGLDLRITESENYLFCVCW